MKIHPWSKLLISTVIVIQSCFASAQANFSQANSIQPKVITYQGDLYKQLNSPALLNKDTSVQFEKSTAEDLKNYSPGKINSMMTEIMSAVKDSKPVETTLKKFPQESLMFFFILGSFTATQLFVEFEKNPMGGMDFLTHQLSPVGMFSFMTFIYMNNVTHTALKVAMKNSELKFLIPHLSMSAGFIAQSVSAQLLSSPNFKGCLQSSLGQKVSAEGAEKNPCAVLYDKEVIKGKILENAPALISMLSSALISGVGEKLVYQGIYKATGVNLYLNLSKKMIQIGRMSVSVMAPLQMTLFTGIQTIFLDPLVFDYWQRSVSASLFHEINNELVSEISKNKIEKWDNSESLARINHVLTKKLSPDFKSYRSQSLRKVLESNASWSRFLENVLKTFSLSYNFYLNFTEELLRHKTDGSSKLDGVYPMYGVLAPALKEGNERTFISKPAYAEKLQYFHVNSSDEKFKIIKAALNNDRQVFNDEKIELNHVLDLLLDARMGGEKEALIKEALFKLQNIKSKMKSNASRKNYYMLAIFTVIGDSKPQMTPGQGFARSLVDYSPEKNIEMEQYPTSIGKFKISHPSEFYILQMICGPNENDKSQFISYSSGFAARFLPPKLIPSNLTVDICDGHGELDSRFIFTTPVSASNGSKYSNIVHFLKENIDESKLGSDQFTKWWLSTVHTSMKAIFDNFSNQYNLVAIDLHKILFNTDKKTNLGPINEAAMGSLLQESKVYSLLLGEIIKDRFQAETGNNLYSQFPVLFNSKIDSEISMKSNAQTDPLVFSKQNPHAFKSMKNVPLLASLDNSSSFEWSKIIGSFPGSLDAKNSEVTLHRSMQFQVELDYHLKLLVWKIQKIQISKKCNFNLSIGNLHSCQTAVSHGITPDEIKKDLELIQSKVTQIETMLGIKESKGQTSLVHLNNDLKTTATQIIGLLNGVITEIATYGNQFSAVNWDILQSSKEEK